MLIDDEDFAVADNVILVPDEKLLGLDRVVEVADERRVERFVEVVDAQEVFDFVDAGLEDSHGPLLLIDLVIGVLAHPQSKTGELRVPLVGVALRRARNDERGARLVDEDRVDLVDDDEIVPALNQVGGLPRHVVAQVVESELVIRAVGDVRRVFLAPLVGILAGEDAPRGKPEETVDASHELGLIGGEVVVDRDDVHAFARQRVEVRGERRHERFALAGLHLGDVAQVERRAAHDLDVVGPLPDGSPGGFAHSGESLGKELVKGFAVRDTLLELLGLPPEFLVRHVLESGLERIDLLFDRLELLQGATLACAEDSVDELSHWGCLLSRCEARGACCLIPF